MPVGGREVGGESVEVLPGGASPFVDRLVGVADGRDRESIAEDRAQQLSLSGGGVLVLVQHHDVVPLPQPACHLGLLGDEGVGVAYEIGVVDDSQRPFQVLVSGDDGSQFTARRPRRFVTPRPVEQQVLRGEQVVAQLARQRHCFGHPVGRRSHVELVERAAFETLEHELPDVSRADDVGVAFDSDECSEVLQQ